MNYGSLLHIKCAEIVYILKCIVLNNNYPNSVGGGVTRLFNLALGAKQTSGTICHPEFIPGSQAHENADFKYFPSLFKGRLGWVRLQTKNSHSRPTPPLHLSHRKGNKAAFSLVELMLSLIIISLIAAAFTPIITKKLKTSSIYAGGGAQQITNKCDDFGDNCELCTKQYCISCNLECSTGQFVDTKICNTCEDCPDNCEECESATKCTKCKSGNNGYVPVNGFCTKCEGSTPYSTGTECTTGCVASGGSYCDSSGNIKSCASKWTACATCDNNECKSCNSYYFMSSGKCTHCPGIACLQCTSTSYCTVCQGDWLLNETSHQCDYVYLTGTSDHPVEGCTGFSGTTASFTCTGCGGGYYYNTSKECTKCTLTGCQTCENNQSANSPKCSICKGGYYKASDGSCNLCTSKYGTNCTTCDSNNCLSCNSGYNLTKDTTGTASCDANDDNFSCSDSNFMRIGNLCITRKNMGDSDTLAINSASGVIKVNASSDYCYSSNNKCCWQGTTSGYCNDKNGGYSGCTRTVCNWTAANAICANFGFEGKKWRLPTSSEMVQWDYSSIGLEANGLQLCDYQDGYSSAFCLGDFKYCLGASESKCHPDRVWGSAVSGLISAYAYGLSTGIGGTGMNTRTDANSVRCVTEME